MGSPKALLRLADGTTFLARIIGLLAPFAPEIVIVTGRHHDAIVAAGEVSSPASVHFARNPDPDRGQLSSLWIGMDAVVRPETQAILMTLVDVPMIAPETVAAVIDAWRQTRAPIVRPAIGARHGHPVIFDRAVFDELRSAPLQGGAKPVVHAHAAALVNVPVDDEGCLSDVDTPEEYRQLLG